MPQLVNIDTITQYRAKFDFVNTQTQYLIEMKGFKTYKNVPILNPGLGYQKREEGKCC